MKQKDAIKLSVALACIIAAALILYLTMRSPKETPPAAPVDPAAAAKATPGAPVRPSSPMRVAPDAK